MLGSKSFMFCPDILGLSGFLLTRGTKHMSESVQVFQTVLSVVYTFEFVIKFSCGPIHSNSNSFSMYKYRFKRI